ncbi:MAG: pyruvate ferredoxin oxidoreductase [Chlorobiaceae bacterium]|nr:pyruvate ferredoxin oxidoreductase [Chlorobiaceae bacterium]
MVEIRWHGRGGQGAFTAARLLGVASALFEHRHALAFPSFGPERRGAPVLGFTRIDDRKLTDRSMAGACDVVAVLDDTLLEPSVLQGLRPDGLFLVNTSRSVLDIEPPPGVRTVLFDASSLASQYLGRPIANTAMLGALAASSDVIGIDAVIRAVRHEMKGTQREKNADLAKAAFLVLGGVA